MEMTDEGGYVLTKRELAVLLDVAHDKKAPLDERVIRFHQRDVLVTDRRCLLAYTVRVEPRESEAFAVDANDLRPIFKSIKIKDKVMIRRCDSHVAVETSCGSVSTKFKQVDIDSLDITEAMLRAFTDPYTAGDLVKVTDRFVISSRFIHLTSKLMTALGDPECWTMVPGSGESDPIHMLAGHTGSSSDAVLVAMPLVPRVDTAPEAIARQHS